MEMVFSFNTSRGTFFIRKRNGLWHILFEGDSLGGYDSPQAAAYDLAGGHSDWPGFGDPSALGISDDISDWNASAR